MSRTPANHHGPAHREPVPPSRSGPGAARWWSRALGACLAAGLLVAGLASPAALLGGELVTRTTASVAATGGSLAGGHVDEASVLTDRTDTPIAYVYDHFRLPVGADRIAGTMKAAIVAIEDRRFFAHDGVDYRGLARALASNAASGSPLDGQGASTITMQYVKNYRLYALAGTPAEQRAATADTIARKLTEVRLAHRLENRLDKQDILARYLDLVYFGRGAYGVEAAARVWFGTTAVALDLPRAALLAGMVRSPGGYDPIDHPDAARARRSEVLTAMTQVGSITPAQADAARASPLGVSPSPAPPPEGCAGATAGAGFFCRAVVDTLARVGIDRATLRTGGLRVATTLDPAVTAAALRAADRTPADGDVATVVSVVEPGGDDRPVRALVANRRYGNDAAAGQSALALPTAPLRGAGSVYKVFTTTAALEAGLVGPDTVLEVPDRYTARSFGDGGGAYTVGNLGSFPSSLTLRQALARSPNTPFVALEDRLGSVTPVVEAARALGLRESLAVPDGDGRSVGDAVVAEQRASFTLGPGPTSPLELASVGATIVDGGRWCPPTTVRSVLDRDGGVVPLPPRRCERAVPVDTAAALRDGLSEDHVDGTSADAADAAGWDRPMIGKTGTTQRSTSAAFLGATDRYSAAVMTFSDRGPPRPVCVDPVRTCAEGNLTGGSVPARTWYDTFTARSVPAAGRGGDPAAGGVLVDDRPGGVGDTTGDDVTPRVPVVDVGAAG